MMYQFQHKWAPRSTADEDDKAQEGLSLEERLGDSLAMPLDTGVSLGSLTMPSSAREDVVDTDDVSALALLPCSEGLANVPLVVGDASGKITLLSVEPSERTSGAMGRLHYRTLSVMVQPPSSSSAAAAGRDAVDGEGANDSIAATAGSITPSRGALSPGLLSPHMQLLGAPRGGGFGATAASSDDADFKPRLTHDAFSADLDRARYPSRKTVQEKILQLAPVAPQMSPHSHVYLAANDMLIKLFRVRGYRNAVLDDGSQPFTNDTVQPLRTFVSTHQTPICSVSCSADGQTMLSLDCFKLLWWSLEAAPSLTDSGKNNGVGSDCNTPVTLFDMSPALGEDVEEIATSACFHPRHASLFLNTSSSGVCRVGDLRDPPSLRARRFSAVMTPEAGCTARWTDNALVARTLQSLTGAVFVGPHHVVTRDYMSWAVWDLRSTGRGPQQRRSVGLDGLAPRMASLFSSERIFDRMPLVVDSAACSSDAAGSSNAVATGLYGDTVVVWENPAVPASPVTMYSRDADGNVSVETTASESEVPRWRQDASVVDQTSRRVSCLAMHGSEIAFASGNKITRLSRSKS